MLLHVLHTWAGKFTPFEVTMTSTWDSALAGVIHLILSRLNCLIWQVPVPTATEVVVGWNPPPLIVKTAPPWILPEIYKTTWYDILYNYCTVPSAISVFEVQYKLILHSVPCYNYYIIWLLHHYRIKRKEYSTKIEHDLKTDWGRPLKSVLASMN